MPVEYNVTIKRSALKNVELLPEKVKERLGLLVDVLRIVGPTGPYKWKNYKPLKGKKTRSYFTATLVKEINMLPVGSTTKKASSSRSTRLGRTRQENIQPTARSGRGYKGLGGFRFKKGTPKSITADFLSRYGRWIQTGEGLGAKLEIPIDPDSSIEYIKTDFHKNIAARLTPGKCLKHLREANGLSQSELGALVGDKKPVGPSRVSDWESNYRAISKPVAKKLANIFHVSVDRFI